MAYCRFSDGDVYLYVGSDKVQNSHKEKEKWVCCMCRLAPLGSTIWTTGGEFLSLKVKPCTSCNGNICNDCGLHEDFEAFTEEETIEHLKEHQKAGHSFDPDVIKDLLEEIKERDKKKKLKRKRRRDGRKKHY